MHTDAHDEPEQTPDIEEEFETTDEAGEEVAHTGKIKQLREKLKEAETEKRSLHEELQRTKADFLNSKKRLEEQQRQAVARSEDKFVASLLPLADSFTMAMKDTAAWEATDEAWRTGVEAIHQQLQRILKDHDVEPLNPLDEPFDPERHEAVATTESDKDSETVVEVVQIGYQRNENLLRPAKVVISS